MNNISLYCNCFRDCVNKKTEYNQKNIILGASSLDSELKSNLQKQGFLFDDTGINISNLNIWFGQLTGLFWTWKNTTEEIIGTNTYRIFWGEYFLNNKFEKNTIYVPAKIDISPLFRGCKFNNNDRDHVNLYFHYCFCHNAFGLVKLEELSNNNKIALKPYMIENLKNEKMLYPFNMFICERHIFDKLCSILFDEILFIFNNEYSIHFDKVKKHTNQIRILDFLSERILHMIFSNIDYYLPNIKVKEVYTIIDLPKQSIN